MLTNLIMCSLNVAIGAFLILILYSLHRSDARFDPLEYVRNLKHTKIIIDTDAGADDALAILTSIQFLRKELNDTEIIGITCAHGNTELDNVKINVLKTLKVAKSLQIPVYAGANSTILDIPVQDGYYYGYDGLGDFEFPNPPDLGIIKSEHAVNALIRLVRENPGEITIFALGPLTNIALAIRIDPTFRKNIKNLIILGGSVSGYGNVVPGIEFNFFTDPIANHIVFNSTNSEEISPLIIMPWDTMALYGFMDKDWRLNVLGKIDNDMIDFINKAEGVSLPKNSYWVSSDTYLATTALNPKIATAAEHYYIAPVTEGEFRGGLLPDKLNKLKLYKNTIVITQVDQKMYKEHLLKCLQD
ncbi:uridine nucleosidase 1-like isoform X2 [Chrysoperla carnea]|uniref:uridine nucleosidase 1-like isoform X2 n=1 Tax=Chrysoperla carnea TaxID=189513 RepID=UPI001D07A3D9|nr:uridine nucleosidase 1-like isoform X2 [Chrysoperla carnea]